MIIKNLNFAGFKFEDNISGLDLTKIENQSIFSERRENKNFLFQALLGVIYGFTENEKLKYKDPKSLVFTGRIDLQFETYTLHIERDFETDIVAILSKSDKEQKSVFQGRDTNVENVNRPYREVLESIFSINSKPFLTEVCREKLDSPNSTFGELLDLLYMFLRPKFKKAAIEKLINSSYRMIESNQHLNKMNGNEITGKLEYAINRLQLLRNSKKISESINSLSSDVHKFEYYWEKIAFSIPSGNDATILKERFPLIYRHDARQIKRDLNHYLELKHSLVQKREQLQLLNSQKEEHLKMLSGKLSMYHNVPDSFIEDFHSFQNLSIDLAQLKNDKDKLDIMLGRYYNDLANFKTKEVLVHLLSAASIVSAGYFVFPLNLPVAVVVSVAVIISFSLAFSKIRKSKKTAIHKCMKDYGEIKRKIEHVEKNMKELRQNSYLLDDIGYVDTHIELFKKFKSAKNILKKIESEKAILEKELKSDKYKVTFLELKKEYKGLIDTDDPNEIKANLEEFLALQEEANSAERLKQTNEKIEPLSKIIYDYKNLIKKLSQTKTEIDGYLNIRDFDKDIDNQIILLERAVTNLKQNN
jgi:hypothetical protein